MTTGWETHCLTCERQQLKWNWNSPFHLVFAARRRRERGNERAPLARVDYTTRSTLVLNKKPTFNWARECEWAALAQLQCVIPAWGWGFSIRYTPEISAELSPLERMAKAPLKGCLGRWATSAGCRRRRRAAQLNCYFTRGEWDNNNNLLKRRHWRRCRGSIRGEFISVPSSLYLNEFCTSWYNLGVKSARQRAFRESKHRRVRKPNEITASASAIDFQKSKRSPRTWKRFSTTPIKIHLTERRKTGIATGGKLLRSITIATKF